MSDRRSRAYAARNHHSYVGGDAPASGLTGPDSPITRLGKRVQVIGDCWVVNGKLDEYGQIKVDGKNIPAHRYVFQQVYGAVLEPSQHVHHRCEHPGCIRPDNLCVLEAGDHGRVHHGDADADDLRIKLRYLGPGLPTG